MKRTLASLAFLLAVLLLPAALNDPDWLFSRPPTPVRIPPRPPGAETGSEFIRRIWELRDEPRENAIVEELSRGNLPPFLRHLTPVELTSVTPRGLPLRVVVWVMPDYLAVGSDEDFVRVPMGLPAALAVARSFDLTLPTAKIVDAIYRQSANPLSPISMKPGPQMTSTAYYFQHHQKIEEQRRGRPLGELVAGHKKDVIFTDRLLRRRDRVVIYGWHENEDSPIQPVSTFHHAGYADYSHGIRLVSPTALVNGRSLSVAALLRDPELPRVLSDAE